LPAWLNEEVRRVHWDGVGPHSAREIPGYNDQPYGDYPLQPWSAPNMNEVRRMFDGYDNDCDSHTADDSHRDANFLAPTQRALLPIDGRSNA
jgi:hypothetical protein